MKHVLFMWIFLMAPVFAQKLVSTSPAITESLVALGLEKGIVAVSDYCSYPFSILSKPKVGSSLTPNWEKMLRLKGDVVLFQNNKDQTIEKKASILNLKTRYYNFNTLEDIEKSVSSIANDFSGDASNVLKNISTAKNKLRKLNLKNKVLMILSVKNNGAVAKEFMVIGQNNHYHDMVKLTGHQNIASFSGYRRWKRELVLKKIKLIKRVIFFNSQIKKSPFIEDRYFKNIPVSLINGLATESVGPRVNLVMEELYELLSP
jgi:ABC-type hemin transport system substrate-binding protein